MKSFSDFWSIIHGKVVSSSHETSGSEPEPAPNPILGEEGSFGEEFSSLQHFAELYVLKADQRYLLREIQINEGILQDQERRLRESREKIKNLELQRSCLAKLRKKMETARNHRVLGGFTQFWQSIEKQAEADKAELSKTSTTGPLPKKNPKKIRKTRNARDFRPVRFPRSCGERKSNGHCGIVGGLRNF